jgi:hypothetical protein
MDLKIMYITILFEYNTFLVCMESSIIPYGKSGWAARGVQRRSSELAFVEFSY